MPSLSPNIIIYSLKYDLIWYGVLFTDIGDILKFESTIIIPLWGWYSWQNKSFVINKKLVFSGSKQRPAYVNAEMIKVSLRVCLPQRLVLGQGTAIFSLQRNRSILPTGSLGSSARLHKMRCRRTISLRLNSCAVLSSCIKTSESLTGGGYYSPPWVNLTLTRSVWLV